MFSLWLSCYRTGVSTQTEMCFWAVRQAAESGRRRQLLSLRRYRWCLYAGTWMVHGRWEELSASTFSFSALNHHTEWLCCSKLLRLCDCCASAQPRWWYRFGTAVCLAWIDEVFFDIHTYRQYSAGKKIKGVLLAALIFITNHRGMLIYYQWGMLLYCGVYKTWETTNFEFFTRKEQGICLLQGDLRKNWKDSPFYILQLNCMIDIKGRWYMCYYQLDLGFWMPCTMDYRKGFHVRTILI